MFDKHRVVVTGIGLITPVGNNKKETWPSVLEGRSGFSYLNSEEFEKCPCRIVGNVTQEQELINSIISPQIQRKTDRFIQLALVAANEAMNDAGLTKEFPLNREKIGAYVGVGIGGLPEIIKSSNLLDTRGAKAVSPFLIPKSISNEVVAWLGIEWNLQGQTLSVVNACSSSADAIGLAYRAISDGYQDYMIAGGTESVIIPLCLTAFGNMRALSSWKGDPKKASRPFDKDRSGFVLSEGSGILILERKDLAEKRGAHIYAEVAGYGSTCDAYHITAPHPQGDGAIRATKNALKEAKINAEDVGYINAHGTATIIGDIVETDVIKNVFGDHCEKTKKNHLLVSSTKSMIGHTLGAAGAIEISLSALALENQIAPPTINLDEADDKCDLDYVADTAREIKTNYALSNSFGFGGANAVVVLKKS
jgi:3-oxoacyl-[acyl-carrier-protein] synthase II